MKKITLAVLLAPVLGALPLLAQEKKDASMKGDMPKKGEGMKGGGMMMGNMKEMHDKMMEMKKDMGGMGAGQRDDEERQDARHGRHDGRYVRDDGRRGANDGKRQDDA